MPKVIIHSNNLSLSHLDILSNTLGDKLRQENNHYWLESSLAVDKIIKLSHSLKVDINIVPESFVGNSVKLIMSDMDSTLISIECIDEIADFGGLKSKVAEITEQAMQGNLDFNQSLRKRVYLLKGINSKVLDMVYKERLKLNSGAENLINKSKSQGIKFALVSGGFTYFTDKLKHRLDLDYTKANVLEIDNSILTGEVLGSIVNDQAKQDYLGSICEDLSIKPSQTITIGDGSNDLKMMKISGLSVAYRAKEVVQKQADVRINYSGLDAVLDFL